MQQAETREVVAAHFRHRESPYPMALRAP